MKEDSNPLETREWLEALDDVVRQEGEERAAFLIGDREREQAECSNLRRVAPGVGRGPRERSEGRRPRARTSERAWQSGRRMRKSQKVAGKNTVA